MVKSALTNKAEILQDRLSEGQTDAAGDPIPRVRPVTGPWLMTDDAYAAQLALKARLIAESRASVLAEASKSLSGPLRQALVSAIDAHPDYVLRDDGVLCPTGEVRPLRATSVLRDAATILQEDLCLLQRRAEGHVLVAAALCFPASWTLAEKLDKPLAAVHGPVRTYDAAIAARVDRLFDGVRAGRPLWRANLLRYDDPSLHQPRPETDPRPPGEPDSPYLRSERQTILRVAEDLVLFAIHTTVVAA